VVVRAVPQLVKVMQRAGRETGLVQTKHYPAIWSEAASSRRVRFQNKSPAGSSVQRGFRTTARLARHRGVADDLTQGQCTKRRLNDDRAIRGWHRSSGSSALSSHGRRHWGRRACRNCRNLIAGVFLGQCVVDGLHHFGGLFLARPGLRGIGSRRGALDGLSASRPNSGTDNRSDDEQLTFHGCRPFTFVTCTSPPSRRLPTWRTHTRNQVIRRHDRGRNSGLPRRSRRIG
jgi:hypothetical protein